MIASLLSTFTWFEWFDYIRWGEWQIKCLFTVFSAAAGFRTGATLTDASASGNHASNIPHIFVITTWVIIRYLSVWPGNTALSLLHSHWVLRSLVSGKPERIAAGFHSFFIKVNTWDYFFNNYLYSGLQCLLSFEFMVSLFTLSLGQLLTLAVLKMTNWF